MVETWVLILFIHAGVLSSKDSVAVTNVTGFTSKKACDYAGELSKRLVNNTTKDIKYVCVKQ